MPKIDLTKRKRKKDEKKRRAEERQQRSVQRNREETQRKRERFLEITGYRDDQIEEVNNNTFTCKDKYYRKWGIKNNNSVQLLKVAKTKDDLSKGDNCAKFNHTNNTVIVKIYKYEIIYKRGRKYMKTNYHRKNRGWENCAIDCSRTIYGKNGRKANMRHGVQMGSESDSISFSVSSDMMEIPSFPINGDGSASSSSYSDNSGNSGNSGSYYGGYSYSP